MASYSNPGHSTGYTRHSVDVSTHAGHAVTITSTGREDSQKQTSFVLDDTALTAFQ